MMQSSPAPKCPKCGEVFPGRNALKAHQRAEGHFVCDTCSAPFQSLEALLAHKRKAHPIDQDLTCPGCTKKFSRAGAWAHHVERGECSGIFPSELAKGLDNALQSKKSTVEEMKASEYDMVHHSVSSHITDVWGAEWENDAPTSGVQGYSKNFPGIETKEQPYGGSKQATPQTGGGAKIPEQRPANAWAQNKKLFPNAPKAVAPPPELLESFQGTTVSASGTRERIIDPYDPNFNVAVFMNPILETYGCPHKRCNSKFPTGRGLISHLKSPAHTGTKFNCPGCRALFTSQAAWIQHAESISDDKCGIRRSKWYGYVLQQMTHGALDVDTLNKLADGTLKLKFDEQWAKSKQTVKSGPLPGMDGNESALFKDKANKTQSSRNDGAKGPQGPQKNLKEGRRGRGRVSNTHTDGYSAEDDHDWEEEDDDDDLI
ncbi:hypothetical protein AAE478_004577 [Parahypoxylon ruwenzoriense]